MVEVRCFGKGAVTRLRVVAPPELRVDREEVARLRAKALEALK